MFAVLGAPSPLVKTVCDRPAAMRLRASAPASCTDAADFEGVDGNGAGALGFGGLKIDSTKLIRNPNRLLRTASPGASPVPAWTPARQTSAPLRLQGQG